MGIQAHGVGGADSVQLKAPHRTIQPTIITLDEDDDSSRGSKPKTVELRTPQDWLSAVYSGQVNWRTLLGHEDRFVGRDSGFGSDGRDDFETVLIEATGLAGDLPCGA